MNSRYLLRRFSTAIQQQVPKPSNVSSSSAASLKVETKNPHAAGETHFGFSQIPVEEKEQRVGQVFERVASKYDVMNDLMSFGVHRMWKSQFIERLSPTSSMKLLDVAGGTGDIAFRFLETARLRAPRIMKSAGSEDEGYTAHVTVCDINPSMLEVGKKRAGEMGYSNPKEIAWQVGNAEQLPFENDQFDAFTIAFGIRNCTNVDQVLREAFRVLKPGGRFMCLEFGKVQNPLISQIYDRFSFDVIPQMGQLVASDKDSYQYLVESIRKFPAQPVFAQMLCNAGFHGVEWEDLSFGIASIHSGWKPIITSSDAQ